MIINRHLCRAILLGMFAITICPAVDSVGVVPGADRVFTATVVDQFGHAMATQPEVTWALESSDAGTLNATTGMSVTFTAGTTSGSWDLTASSGSGSELVSDTVEINVDGDAPSAPTGLMASNTTHNSTDLSWTASTDASGIAEYEVFQDGGSIGTTSDTSFSVTGLSADTTYDFTVVAYDTAGNDSDHSEALSVTTESGPSYLAMDDFESGDFNGGTGWIEAAWAESQSDGNTNDQHQVLDEAASQLAPSQGTYHASLIRRSQIARSVDLSAASGTTITFSWAEVSLNADEQLAFEVNDGNGWVVMDQLSNGSGGAYAVRTVDLSTYDGVSSLQIRFTTQGSGNGDYGYVDDVKISAGSGGAEPDPTRTITMDNLGGSVWDCTPAGTTTGSTDEQSVHADLDIDADHTLTPVPASPN